MHARKPVPGKENQIPPVSQSVAGGAAEKAAGGHGGKEREGCSAGHMSAGPHSVCSAGHGPQPSAHTTQRH